MADVRRSVSEPEHAATIKVVGVGGGGCNAVNRMIAAGLSGVDFFAVNSDVQALRGTLTENRVHIGGRSDARLGSRREPDARPRSGRGVARRSVADPRRRRSRLSHRRHGRRHGHRRCAGHRRARARVRRADDRRRDQAVRLRGQEAHADRRERHRRARVEGRHAHHDSERAHPAGHREEDAAQRGLLVSPTTCCAKASPASAT